MKTKPRNKTTMAAAMSLLALLAVALCDCHNETKQNNDAPSSPPLPYTNQEKKDFEFMYDVGTTHPWSSYVSENSSHVLRLEMIHSDSIGSCFRVLVFEPVYWYKGGYQFPELGSEPTYVGYGTLHALTPDYIDYSFISGGYSDWDECFVLSGYRSSWDSILEGNMCPPISSIEDIKSCVYRKRSWEDILLWWNNEQNRWNP